MDKERKQKEKQDFLEKQRQVKQILDEQLLKRREIHEIEKSQKKEIADWVRQVDKNDMEAESKKKLLLRVKMLEAKKMRDNMLQEALEKKLKEDRIEKSIENVRC